MKSFFTLLVTFLLIININAQVGVNNNNPGQALDVNGKIKLTDDATTPTAGTMRYNNTDASFEGHDGTDWNSFTAKSNGPLPSSAIPVFAYENIVRVNESETIVFKDWNGTTYNSIPSGKMIIVTGIYPSPNNASIVNNFYALEFNAKTSGGSLVSNTRLRISGYENVSEKINSDLSPLMVIKSGQSFSVFNFGSSEAIMSVSVRGFLVDDINY